MKKLLWISTLFILMGCDGSNGDNGGWISRKHKAPKPAQSASAPTDDEHTETVTALVTKWHGCHMQRNANCLQDLSAEQITYYQKKLSREAYLQQKERLFTLHPDFYLDANISVGVVKQDANHMIARLTKRVKDAQGGVKDHALELVFLMPQRILIEERSDDLIWTDGYAIPPAETAGKN